MSENASETRLDRTSIAITICCALSLAVCHYAGLQLGVLIFSAALISIVIWQACDPFAEAAQWIGQTFKIPGSVRGATLDAVASSMPELFTGVFFVVVAIQAGAGGGEEALHAAGAEGFGAAVATAAGSAVYNMILIPACVAFVVSIYRRKKPIVEVEREVLTRDGMWFSSSNSSSSSSYGRT